MSGRVDGKVAIVTGGASGIGRATAQRLAAEGARVAVADVAAEAGLAVASKIGGDAFFLPLDVTDESRWQAAVAEVEQRCGRLDVLVNNAGIVVFANVEETTLEQWRRIHAVNVEGVFLGCKHAIPAMRRAGGGSIINVSSVAAMKGLSPYPAYSASKGAVRALTKSVAAHCKEQGLALRCNSIHPGGVDTPMVRNMMPGAEMLSEEQAEGVVAAVRAAGMTVPSEIASLVLYLASDESAFVNAAELVIDGGMLGA